MAERLLAGASAKLRAKIAQKQEFRPTRTVEKNMPVGLVAKCMCSENRTRH